MVPQLNKKLYGANLSSSTRHKKVSTNASDYSRRRGYLELKTNKLTYFFYKCERNDGCYSYPLVPGPKSQGRSRTVINRQYNSSCIYKPSWLNKIQAPCSSCNINIDLVLKKGNSVILNPHCRFNKSICRLSVTFKKRFDKMDLECFVK